MLPLVSFIIPYYNSGATIQETIDSIFNQSYTNFEIWIINDGSTHTASIEKLKDFENDSKINILHQENGGPSIARNNAIRQSKAEFIVPLDADNKISKNTLSLAIPQLIKDERIGVVYGNLQFFEGKNNLKIQEPFDIKKQLLWNQIDTSSVIKKEVFESVGYYDDYLSQLGLEDWEFWIRVYKEGWGYEKIEEIFFEIRITEHSRTFQVANKNVEKIKEYVYLKHSKLLAKEYQDLYYKCKMLGETPDYNIGNFILLPYRLIKNIFKTHE